MEHCQLVFMLISNLYHFGGYYNGQSGMGIVGIGNPDLKWEKTVLSMLV